MPRKSFNDENISRGKNFAKIKDFLFPSESREQIGGKLGGVSEGTIRSWEKGKPIPNRVLVELERRGVSLMWLLASEGEMMKDVTASSNTVEKPRGEAVQPPIPFPAGARPAENLIERPVRGLAAADDSHGTRVPDTDEIGEPYRFPESLVLVPVVGDSMSPVALNGQYVGIDREREGFESDGGIYVVSVLEPGPDDDYPEPLTGTFVKRCEMRENLYYLESVNGDYSPFSVNVDHCRIWPVLGVWFGGKGKPPEGF